MDTQMEKLLAAQERALQQKNEADRKAKQAKKQIEVEKENALRQIRAQVADLSIDIAERVVRQQLKGNAQQEQYIERILDEMSTSQS